MIALVVTIIVLLILAAVAINLTIGENGIFTRAQDATEKWQEAEVNEQDEMNKAVNTIDNYINGKNPGGPSGEYNTGTTVDEAKKQNKPFEKDTTIKDDLQNEVRIPGGFHIAEDSATKVEDGIVIEDDIGNQFVWIPAKTGTGATIHTTVGDKTIVYKRTALDDQVATGEIDETTNSEKIKSSSSESYYYTEKMPTDEEASVNVNGGYYIGRYEAGDKVSTDAGKMRASGDNQQNEVSIKAGQAPYVWATYENQKALAEGMGSKRGYIGTTKMVSSYAWDTAINFIKIKTPDYDSNSLQGNYLDTTFSYANVGETEKTQIKENGSSQLVPTGQTTAVSNIYDMGGNAYERTTESYSRTSNPFSFRGGDYYRNASNIPAGYRAYGDGAAFSSFSFRVTLFCSTER